MELSLRQLAIATGGTLVIAAGKKKAAKPSNLQHHKTFGIKKPKGALPGPSAGGVLKRGGKKVIIPDTRNSLALEKLSDKINAYSNFFKKVSGAEWTYTYKSAKAEINVEGDKVHFDVKSPLWAKAWPYFVVLDIQKVTTKQIEAFARYVQEVGAIKLPKLPAFIAK